MAVARRGLAFTTELLFVAMLLLALSIYLIGVSAREPRPDPDIAMIHVESMSQVVTSALSRANDPNLACELIRGTLESYTQVNVEVNVTHVLGATEDIICMYQVVNVNEETWAAETTVTLPSLMGGLYVAEIRVGGR